MSIKKRLDLIVKQLGLSGRAFEKECGLANGSYSSIRDGVGADKLNKILLRFPNISAEWLISGNGEMMKKQINPEGLQGGSNILNFHQMFSENNGQNSEPGAVFAVDSGRALNLHALNPLNRPEMKTVLFQLADILSGHQQEVSRLITELELNGKRSDRLLDLIEQGFASAPANNQSADEHPAEHAEHAEHAGLADQ